MVPSHRIPYRVREEQQARDLLVRYAQGERDFQGICIRVSDTEKTPLNGAILSGANLTKAELFVDLDGANLDNCNLTDAVLQGSPSTFDHEYVGSQRPSLVKASFRGACLVRARLGYTSCREADFTAADMTGADLRRCDLRGARLVGARLGGADLSGTVLDGADLSDAHLVGAMLAAAPGRTGIGSGLRDALSDNGATSISGACLRGANLRRAKLRRALLVSSDLTNARFVEADFSDATIEACTLSATNFDRALFSGTRITSTDILCASLSNTRHRKPCEVGFSTLALVSDRALDVAPEQLQTIGRFLVACGVPEAVLPWSSHQSQVTLLLPKTLGQVDRELVDALISDVLGAGSGCRVVALAERREVFFLQLSGSLENLETVAVALHRRAWEPRIASPRRRRSTPT